MYKSRSVHTERINNLYPRQFSIKLDMEKGKRQLNEKKLEYNKTEKKYKRANLKGENKIIKLDDEIDNLNNKITELITKNYDLDLEIEKEVNLKTKYEIEQKRRTHECNKIKSQFNYYYQTVLSYKNSINKITEENKSLQEEYDNKINELSLENEVINRKLGETNDLFNLKKKECAFAENKVIDILKQINNQREYYNERNKLNEKRYIELEKKFTELQNKINSEELAKNLNKEESNKQKKIESSSLIERKSLENKISLLEKSNEIISKEIGLLKKQYKKLITSSSLKKNNKKKRK
jgi:hypothetical protein